MGVGDRHAGAVEAVSLILTNSSVDGSGTSQVAKADVPDDHVRSDLAPNCCGTRTAENRLKLQHRWGAVGDGRHDCP